VLLPDSLFCHKCGKPQRDIAPEEEPAVVVPEVESAAAPPVIVPPALPGVINFHNKLAVRTGLLCAGLSLLAITLSPSMMFMMLWMLFWLTVAGFMAVYLYHRRSGQFLSVRGGARMGWITGLFCFLIALVIFSISAIAQSFEGGLVEAFRKQMTMQGSGGPEMEQMLQLIESPGGMAALLGLMVVFLFFMFAGLPVIGGALCAKVLEKD
jgi:hypothetical protein